MTRERMNLKEEAILIAKEKIEEAADALSEFFPELAEELNWFLEELGNRLIEVRSDRLALAESALYSGGNV